MTSGADVATGPAATGEGRERYLRMGGDESPESAVLLQLAVS